MADTPARKPSPIAPLAAICIFFLLLGLGGYWLWGGFTSGPRVGEKFPMPSVQTPRRNAPGGGWFGGGGNRRATSRPTTAPAGR